MSEERDSSPTSPSAANQEVADEIRRERSGQRKTQAEVYEAAGMPRTTYIRYETGERDIPLPALVAIANALGTTAAEIFRHAEERNAGAFAPPMTVTEEGVPLEDGASTGPRHPRSGDEDATRPAG
jgi:transcriptional regulator with XRE-family HTH domain